MDFLLRPSLWNSAAKTHPSISCPPRLFSSLGFRLTGSRERGMMRRSFRAVWPTTHGRNTAFGGTDMSPPQHEIVRMGASGARIVAVTRQRIDYLDMAGREQFIDLEECARRWGRGTTTEV